MFRRLTLLLAALALAAGACASDPDPLNVAIVANAHQAGTVAVGEQRLLFGYVDEATNASLASPDLPVEIDLFYVEDPNDPRPDEVDITVPGTFMWTTPGVRGVYRATVTLDRAGIWGVVLRPEGMPPTHASLFQVVEDSTVPDVGDPAPAVPTPTAATDDLTEITTDPNPDPRFYELSLDEAIASGAPTVVVFATPRFCQSATCGPVLDMLKPVADAWYPKVHFVHVEVYTNLDAQTFEELEVVPAVIEWRLPSEPWVFVVGPDGRIAARYEGTIDPAELEPVLADLTS